MPHVFTGFWHGLQNKIFFKKIIGGVFWTLPNISDGALYENSQRLLAVNHFCETLILDHWQGSQHTLQYLGKSSKMTINRGTYTNFPIMEYSRNIFQKQSFYQIFKNIFFLKNSSGGCFWYLFLYYYSMYKRTLK